MKLVRDVLIIAWMRFYPDLRRQPLLQLLLTAFFGILPIFFIWVFGRAEMIPHGVVGALVAGVSFIGVSAGVQDIAWDRYVKLREMMVSMPIHPISYALGISIAALLMSLPGMAIFAAIAFMLGFLKPEAAVWIIPPVLLAWSSMSAFGFTISTYLHKANVYTLNLLSNLIGFGLVFVTPVYYPADLLGGYKWLALVAPPSNSAELIRAHLGLSNTSGTGVMAHWLVLLAESIIFVLLLSLKAKWREE